MFLTFLRFFNFFSFFRNNLHTHTHSHSQYQGRNGVFFMFWGVFRPPCLLRTPPPHWDTHTCVRLGQGRGIFLGVFKGVFKGVFRVFKVVCEGF